MMGATIGPGLGTEKSQDLLISGQTGVVGHLASTGPLREQQWDHTVSHLCRCLVCAALGTEHPPSLHPWILSSLLSSSSSFLLPPSLPPSLPSFLPLFFLPFLPPLILLI